MCGLAGSLTTGANGPVGFDELRRMIAMLGVRGPDGYGLYRDDRVGFAHARLSLVDLAGGAQPVHNEDETIWLTFNGEIFNYIELREELIRLGHTFYTAGDSEVIVQCYQRYGEKTWAMLNGQFAFALWDGRVKKLWLVRDRMGVLPLHYARAGKRVLFASEAKAIFASGALAPRFDAAGLAEAFTTWAPSAPATVFEGVAQVEPGAALCFDAELRARETRFWAPVDNRDLYRNISDADADDLVEQALKRSIRLRLRADVPVGMYVSGGLDSSLISILARDVLGVEKVSTFGIGFADARFDETREQRIMAEAIGSDHHEIRCDADDIAAALDEVIWRCEAPLLRTAPAPMFLLAQLVRKSGVKTVLTGEGADELFAGYAIFKEDQIRRFWARQPNSAWRPALLSRIHHYVGGGDARANALWREFFARGLGETDHPFYSHLIRWRNNAWTLRLLNPDINTAGALEPMLARIDARMPEGWRDWDSLTRAQLIEMRTFMSAYLLAAQGDRVALGNGVEARYPFLDPDLIDLALSLPKRCKLDVMTDKAVLRRIARRRLPESIWRREKHPYRAPIAATLLRGGDGWSLKDALNDEALAAHGLCNGPAVAALLARAERRGGQGLGEREEMGLIGVYSLTRLSRHYGAEFSGRVKAAEGWLAQTPLQVHVDQAAPQAGRAAASGGASP